MFGNRGEGWVIGQVLLLAAVVFVPRIEPEWPFWLRIVAGIPGLLIFATGVIFAGYGVRGLGNRLTPLPKPGVSAVLIQGGIFGCVRHPIYGGLAMIAIGFALLTGSLARVGVAFALLGYLAAKSMVEERWLVERFPEYRDYQRRVRRILPGLW